MWNEHILEIWGNSLDFDFYCSCCYCSAMTIFTLFTPLVRSKCNVKHNKEIKEVGLLRWLIKERHMPLSMMGEGRPSSCPLTPTLALWDACASLTCTHEGRESSVWPNPWPQAGSRECPFSSVTFRSIYHTAQLWQWLHDGKHFIRK